MEYSDRDLDEFDRTHTAEDPHDNYEVPTKTEQEDLYPVIEGHEGRAGEEPDDGAGEFYPEPTSRTAGELFLDQVDPDTYVLELSPEMKFAFVFWTRLFLSFFTVLGSVGALLSSDFSVNLAFRDTMLLVIGVNLVDVVVRVAVLRDDEWRANLRFWNLLFVSMIFYFLYFTYPTINLDNGLPVYIFMGILLMLVIQEHRLIDELLKDTDQGGE